MRRDLGRLRIDKIIVHEIPVRPSRGGGSQPVLSDRDSDLTQELKNFFRERITESLASAAYDVCFDPTSTSPVPLLVLDNLGARTTSFVDMSKQLASHLHNCQTGVNPAGVLTVVQASIESIPSLAILKLEKEEGVRVRQQQHQDGVTLSIEHIRDLMLTAKTKVFKVGLFVQEGTELETIHGVVSDKQRGLRPTTEVASFFLEKFLGCQLREAPEITTKRFYAATEAFINQSVADPLAKARYQIGLLAALSSEEADVSPRVFANRFMQLGDRQKYIEWLEASGVPVQPFPKNIALLEPQLHRIHLGFASGISLLATPESFDRHVTMMSLEDGRTRVQVDDKLLSVKGRR